MISLLWILKAECSSALVTDMYESLRSVYFPTSAMVTVSKSRSWLSIRQCQDIASTGNKSAPSSQFPPPLPKHLTSLLHLRTDLYLVQFKSLGQELDDALRL